MCKLLSTALELSKVSNVPRMKVACIIARNTKILGWGLNSVKSHPKSKFYSKKLHAEHAAIISTSTKNHSNLTAYVARYVVGTGERGLARPCHSCARHLLNSGVKKVVYTIDNYTYGVLKLSPELLASYKYRGKSYEGKRPKKTSRRS